jgi:RNA polymerase sigma-70 factor, ECF subfamily
MTAMLVDAEDVFNAHVLSMTQLATGLVGPTDAADVVINAFVRLMKSTVWADGIDHRALWARTVVLEARSFHRSTYRRRLRETAWLQRSSQAPRATETVDLLAKLNLLSVQQREVVVLTYWRELNATEVALLLDVSTGTVRKQLARAHTKLRRSLPLQNPPMTKETLF